MQDHPKHSLVAVLSAALILSCGGVSPTPLEPVASGPTGGLRPPVCGDGRVDDAEACDPGVQYLGGCPEGWGICWGCSADCRREPYSARLTTLREPHQLDQFPWCDVGPISIRYDSRGFAVSASMFGFARTISRGAGATGSEPGSYETYEDGHLVLVRSVPDPELRPGASPSETRLSYDGGHLVLVERWIGGHRLSIVEARFDGSGRIARVVEVLSPGAEPQEREFFYDVSGRLREVRGAAVEVPTFDERGDLVALVTSIGGVDYRETRQWHRNTAGHVLRVVVSEPGTEGALEATCLEQVFATMPERPFQPRE